MKKCIHKIENMPFTTLFNLFLSLTDEPLLCSYILIGNRVHVKSSGMAPQLANARPPGSAKFANVPPPGLTRRPNAPR